MIIVDGKAIARSLIDELKKKPTPNRFLAVFVVGDHIASHTFISRKEKIAQELGVDFRITHLAQESLTSQVCDAVSRVASDDLCGGIVVQLPLPAHIDAHAVLNTIPPEKDIEVLSEKSLGAFYTRRSLVLPPAVSVVDIVLNRVGIPRKNLFSVAVVGQGLLVGRPVTAWFAGAVPVVYALNKGSDLGLLSHADIVICGAGHSHLIKSSMLKTGAGVIDFGCDFDEQTRMVCGDFDASSVEGLSFYTPTPGGTGPILIACLFSNFFMCAHA